MFLHLDSGVTRGMKTQTVTQALYKSEYAKADQFVGEMVTGSEVAMAKSPPEEESEELELKVNARWV